MDRRLGVFVLLISLCVASLIGVGETTITNILINPDFDLGPGLPWVEYSQNGYDIISLNSSLPYFVLPLPSEPYAAWLGGDVNDYDYLYQYIAIPDYATNVELKGYRYIATEEEFGAYDHVTVDVNGSIIFAWTNEDSTESWTEFSTSLSQFIGKTIRLRIIATTDSSFYTAFFFDSLELNIQYSEIIDVAVTDVMPSKTVVCQGYDMPINVTVTNEGNFTETFNVTAYANTTAIQTLNVTDLPPGNRTMTFVWNTTGWDKGIYTIGANATTVSGEIDTADNICVDGTVRVSMVGDIAPPFGTVNILDILYVAVHFGATVGDSNYDPNADVDGNGVINILDILVIAVHFGETDP